MAEGDVFPSDNSSLNGAAPASDIVAAVSSVSCLWPKGEHSRAAHSRSSSSTGGGATQRSLVPSSAILFSLNDFKFLCAKYVSAQEQSEHVDKVLCSSLDDIISQCHLMWAIGSRLLLEAALRPALAATLTRTCGSASHYGFKDSWLKCVFAGESEDNNKLEEADSSGGGGSGGSDFMMIPAAPSAAMRGALRDITKYMHEKIFSVDSFQIYCGAAGGITNLARHVCGQLITECLAVISKSYRDALDNYRSSAGVDKSLGSSSDDGSPDDVVAMQLVFDLSSALAVLECPGQMSAGALETARCIDACKEAMDPVTAHLGLPLIQGKVQEFCRTRRLIYNLSTLMTNGAESVTASASTAPAESRAYFAGSVYEPRDPLNRSESSVATRQQRFALLPLPSLTSSSSAVGSSGGKHGRSSVA